MKPFVFFDLGGTLIDDRQRQARFRDVARRQGIELEEVVVARAFLRADQHFMEQRPALWRSSSAWMRQEHARRVMEELGLAAEVDPSWTAPWTGWEPFDETAPVLRWLRGMDYSCGLITNWDYTARAVLDRLNLRDFFRPVVISAEVGCSKPDRRIFELALDRLGITAREVVYVGDNYWDDVEGARAVGMEAVLVDRHPEWSGRAHPCPTVASLWGLLDHLAPGAAPVGRTA